MSFAGKLSKNSHHQRITINFDVSLKYCKYVRGADVSSKETKSQ